jgi:hypothetical protein
VWVGALAGCGDGEAAPVTVARQFAAAVQTRDVEAVLELVDQRAASLLQQAAERAGDQVGGRRNIAPHEMLQIVDVDPLFQVAETELVEITGQTARVRIVGADGSQYEIDLVLEGERWRVKIPVPAQPADARGT